LVPGAAPRVLLIVAASALVGLTFWLDRQAADNLFPRRALSLGAPIGLTLWILALHGMTQTSVTLFLPLLLQVVHRVSPVVINFLSIVISMGWTTATFTVSGWSGRRERFALASGPVIATTGLVCLTAVASCAAASRARVISEPLPCRSSGPLPASYRRQQRP
jgi:hypothetical protein